MLQTFTKFKPLVLFACLLLLLYGCSSSKEIYLATMQNWVGRNRSEVSASWDVKKKSGYTPIRDGKNDTEWLFTKTDSIKAQQNAAVKDNTTGTQFPAPPTPTVVFQTTVKFIFGPDNKVVSWSVTYTPAQKETSTSKK